MTALGLLRRRLLGVDRAQEEGREEEGNGVDDERERGLQRLDEQSPETRPGDEGERPASGEPRRRADVVPRSTTAMKSEAYETEKRTVIVPAAKATASCSIVSASKAYARGMVANSPARARSVKIIVDAASSAVDPRAGVKGEEQVRRQLGGDEVAHLGGVRVQDEDGCEWDRDQRDLVAEERDRLGEPEAPEDEVLPEKRRQEPPQCRSRSMAAWATRVARRSEAEPTPPPFQVSTALRRRRRTSRRARCRAWPS